MESRSVIHLVDEATYFSAATFLQNQTTSEIGKTITRLWIHSYMGPPYYLVVDQGSSYITKEIKSNLEASGVALDEALIETSGSIVTVEPHHAPLRCANNKVRSSLNKKTRMTQTAFIWPSTQ